MTWEFLLKSTLKLSAQRQTEVNGRSDVLQAGPTPASEIPEPHNNSRPPSYWTPVQTESATTEANKSAPTMDMVGNEDVPELSIALDEEESHIFGAVIEQRFSSFGLSREDARVFQSDASEHNEAMGHAKSTDEIELAPILR